MYPRRSSRLPKVSQKSPQKSPSPKKEVIKRGLRGKRWRTGQRKTDAGGTVVNTDEAGGRDIIDIINSAQEDAKPFAIEDEVKFVEVADDGVDKSDEDCCSVNSSIVSGPSSLRNCSPEKPCSACRKLYQKAKRMKAPIKNKLLDNDPKSLTCDQWVLIKKRKRRLPNARGKCLNHAQLIRLQDGAERTEQCAEEGEPSACSRPHIFLQRNLRRRVRVPVKKQRKKNRRKRTRDDSQGPCVAKQQRLHGENHRRAISIDFTNTDSLHATSGHSSSPGFEAFTEQEINNPADADPIVELIPSTVTMETTKPREVPPKLKTPKKTGGFRDLLALLRGTSSKIIRETR